MMNNFITALRLFVVLAVVTGVIYPLAVTLAGKTFFKKEASGNLVIVDGRVRGSELIGQDFKGPEHFWPRPSAINYNPLPSGGSNLGPTSSSLRSAYMGRKGGRSDVPIDMLFASGSGLDPHISVEAARYQVPRIALQRRLSGDQAGVIYDLIDKTTERRTLGILGEERVNVLKLNMALDRMFLTYGK